MLQAINKFLYSRKKYTQAKEIQNADPIQIQLSSKIEHSKIIKWQDGTIYIGQCQKETMCGNGKLIYPNGHFYQGQFKDNHFHGKGVYYSEEGICDGEWEYGLKNGFVKQSNKDGSKFIGKYEKGSKIGMGFFQWADGSFYQGMFKQDFMQGPGKMVYNDGTQLYGNWKQNSIQGIAKQINKQGDVYIGCFKNGIKQGRGLLIKDQLKIEGSWQNGSLKGLAILQKSDGYLLNIQSKNDHLTQITDEVFQKLRDEQQKQTNS